MRFLCLLLLFISHLSFAQTEASPYETSPYIEQLNSLNQEIKTLQQESENLTGTAQNVVHQQLLTKNDDLRDTLSSLINETPIEAKPLLLKQVKQQIQFVKEASNYLDKQINLFQAQLDKVGNEEKLLAQKSLDEARQLSSRMLQEQWTNYQWLKTLGEPQPKQIQSLIKQTDHRLEFMSASLRFDNQQAEQLSKQLSSAANNEKASIQLLHILATRSVESDISTLQYLVQLGDTMGMDTSSYKKQLFETTGNVTNDLLNTKVMWSIASNWAENIGQWLLHNTPQMLFKVFIFIVIIFVFKLLRNLTTRMVKRAVGSPNLRMSQLMQEFFISMSGKAIFFIGLLIALAQVGLDLTPILTGFGVAGVIIGFALQDTLSNFASGMMLLIYRPFDVNDFVEAGGVSGKVSHMSLVNTTIKTFDNQIIIVPNSKIWGDTIKNVTHERVRRIDMVFGIGYKDSIEHAEKVLNDIIDEHPLILKSPEKTIKVHTLNTSSVDFIVRPWVKTDDYWDVYWDVTREVKLRFDRENISIPFPQQDVHLHMVKEQISSISTQ